VLGCCLSSCGDDENNNSGYDPSKPIGLTDFSPTEGRLATQVILTGSNFGYNKDNVKVFFNDKEAAVISAKGDRILVLAPKRASTVEDPMCVIKVQVQDQEATFEQKFDYNIQTTVTTLTGGVTSASENPTGTVSLTEAAFRSSIDRPICIDADKNVFFLVDNNGKFACFMMNEESNMVKCLKEDLSAFLNAPLIGYSSVENKVYALNANRDVNDIAYFDPQADYAYTSSGSFDWNSSDYEEITGWSIWASKHNYTMGPDGYFYCRMLCGYIIRQNPITRETENLVPGGLVGSKNGSTRGLAFDPQDDNVLYFSVDDQHCIYKFNILTKEWECFAGQEGNGGYLDGPLTQAMFNKPAQLCFDSEGNMIVADTENHCIRKITMSTGYVSTLAGTPQKSGYTNGTADVAQFNKPIGLVIDSDDVMYIGDSENRAIRRLAIE